MLPQRIVCLAAEAPEILQAVGALPRVVGISAHTTRPAEALSLPRVSGFSRGSVERILSVHPDLAITTSVVQRALAAELIGHGLSVLHTSPVRLTDVLASITLVGSAVGGAEAAAALVERLRREAGQVEAAGCALPRRPRVYFEEWDDPLLHGIGWVSDLISLAGGTDVFADRLPGAARAEGRIVRPEEVVDRDPEVIFASWCGKAFDRAALEARPGWADIAAVREGRVHALDGDVLQAGPGLLRSLRQMHAAVAACARGAPA